MTTQPSNPSHRAGSAAAMILLGSSYPLLAHVAVLSGRPGLIAASVGVLVVLILLPGLRNRRPLAWAMLVASGIVLHAAAGSAQTLLLLFLPPILINGFMAWIFGHTLRHGRMPLIERIIRALHEPKATLSDDIVDYARGLTGVWAGLFVVLGTASLLMAMFARPGGFLLAAGLEPGISVPLGVWSLFANVLNYVIVATLFVVEYRMRRRRFPQQQYSGLLDFTRRVAGVSAIFRPSGAGLDPESGAGSRKP